MKTLKLTTIIGLLFLFGTAKADKPKTHAAFTMKFSIAAFIDADTRGICDGLTDIIADNAKFDMMRGDQMITVTKKQLLNHMETLRGVEQNCTTKYAVLETRNNYALIKVEMKYPQFTRINYVTMNECSEGWKITNVTSVFTK